MAPLMSQYEPKPRPTWERSPWLDLWRTLRLAGTAGVILGTVAVVVLAIVDRKGLTVPVQAITFVVALVALPMGVFFFVALRIMSFMEARTFRDPTVPPPLRENRRWEQVFLGLGVPSGITFLFVTILVMVSERLG